MRINSRVEKYNYQSLVKHLLTIYCEEINNAVRDENWVNTMLRFDDQIYYCKQQRKNKKTIAVLSKWFDKEWARNYIDTVLFDVPVMKVSPDGSTVQT
jgi:phycocyanobilin:ferredoxin oxidoreductase